MTEKAWQNASNQPMPAMRRLRMQATVIPTYTSHNALAVDAMRGVSFESFIGPGVSALKSCMPPTPSSGSTATVSTMMPMPPIQCMR